MVKITNIFGDQYSGQAGKCGVFAKWKGRQYRRAYVIPANPKTTMQKVVRGYFTNAITAWHTYHSIQRLVYSYLATGLVMSGMNLLVRRWQLAATKSLTLPYAPSEGIKQICSAFIEETDFTVPSTANPTTIENGPMDIGSCLPGTTWASPVQELLVDIEMGDVRIPIAIDEIPTGANGSEACAVGDILAISYTSGGRTITREVFHTLVAEETEFDALATIGVAYRTEFYPIDFKSVVVESYNTSTESWDQLESEEYDNINHKAFLDLTALYDATDTHKYTSFTPIEDAKLEVCKVDTSFITWRRYSNVNGHIPIAQTIEDETYDWSLSRGTYISEIRAAQSSILATKHELVKLLPIA